MSKTPVLFLAAYFFVAVATFGYAAARARCDDGFNHMYESDCRSASGMVSAMAWPLYWSWEVAERSGVGSDRP